MELIVLKIHQPHIKYGQKSKERKGRGEDPIQVNINFITRFTYADSECNEQPSR